MTAPSSPGPYLVFELGQASGEAQGTFAMDVSNVFQVIEPASLVPVPLAPSVVLGILNHHGRIITVVDPAPLIELPTQGERVTQVVILRQSLRGSPNLGLQVARSHGIVPHAELVSASVEARPCVAWVAQAGKRLIHIIDPAPLLERLGRLFGSMDGRESLQGVAG